MNEFEFNQDNEQIGYRLQYVEVLNWGTFNEHIWSIEPNGKNALLTGEVGAGKSTIVDAITTLLVPQGKITYNKAANAKSKERNLLSYIKGYYKEIENVALTKGVPVSHRYKDKNDTTFTVIIANFYNVGYESHVSLAQVLWIKDEVVQKLLVVSKTPLHIKDYFAKIEDVPGLRKKLKSNSEVELFGDNFANYSQRFKEYLGIKNDNALLLFYQTISMKSMDNLSDFVKEEMLEKTNIEEEIKHLIQQFEDLTRAHNAVLKAREQRDMLFPIVNLTQEYTNLQHKTAESQQLVEAIPAYFAKLKIALLEKDSENAYTMLDKISKQKEELEKVIEEIETQQRKTEIAIRDNGGRRLEEIAEKIKGHQTASKQKEERYNSYVGYLKECEITAPKKEKSFHENTVKIAAKKELINENQEELGKTQGELNAKIAEWEGKIEENTVELQELKGRKSNIDHRYLKIRQELAARLDIEETDIPFVGELLKVADKEQAWQGAIERLAKTFAISVIVPQSLYPQVSSDLNDKHLGIKLEYYRVPKEIQTKRYNTISSNSVVDKLEIKPDTEYEVWLQNEIENRFNLQCVSIEDYQRMENVITKEGQYKIGKQRNIKDDRQNIHDKRYYVLGWSNIQKIKAIEAEIIHFEAEKTNLEEQLLGILSQIKNNKRTLEAISKLETYTNWFDLNYEDEVLAIETLKKEKIEIEESNDILKTLESLLLTIKDNLKSKKEARDKKIGDFQTNEDKIKTNEEDIKTCKETLNSLFETEQAQFFPILAKLYSDTQLNLKNIEKEQRDKIIETNRQKDEYTKKQAKYSNEIVRCMQDFNNKYLAETTDLSAKIESSVEYLAVYEKIIEEGLPKHEEKFKSELKEKTIQNLVAFWNYLDIEYKKIGGKVKIINDHLYPIEYNNGTYIELLDTPVQDEEIREFKAELKGCYEQIRDMSDAYTEVRFSRVKQLLDKFKSQESASIKWTQKVTDVRNWNTFNARENYRTDDSLKESYYSSAGKSGGQKEKLAYTILASSLAYQFGLTHNEPKSKSFRFVIIDEAFGRGDAESTAFGLNLFKQLHLQLLVITPMQKISIIENYVKSVHVVSKNDKDISQIQNLTVEEYKHNKEMYQKSK